MAAIDSFQAGPLDAGTYTPALFGRPFTVDVDDGWYVNYQLASSVSFTPESAPVYWADREVIVTDLTSNRLAVPPYPPDVVDRLGIEYDWQPIPDDFAGWLAGQDWMMAGPIQIISVDGVEVTTFDYRVPELDDEFFDDGAGPAVAPFAQGGKLYFFPEGDVGRLWFLTLDGATLMIDGAVHDDADADGEAFLADAGALVESMTFP